MPDFTVAQVAKLLKKHPTTIHYHIRGGKIAALQIGRKVLISEEEVQRLITAEVEKDGEAGKALLASLTYGERSVIR